MANVCARCPKLLGRSCCEVVEGQKLATLTSADVRRISAYLRQRPERFSEVEWLSVGEVATYEAHYPILRGYFASSTGRTTLRAQDGACVLFRPGEGCTLPSDVRPRLCRLYPFEVRAGFVRPLVARYGSVPDAKAAQDGCLAMEEAEDLDALYAAFGTSEAEVKAMSAALGDEAREHGRTQA